MTYYYILSQDVTGRESTMTTTETIEQKTEYWDALQSKTQTAKINHQYTKVSTAEEKAQKAKTQAYYERELAKIREIQDAIEHLTELERNF